jgi:hypothetical protein
MRALDLIEKETKAPGCKITFGEIVETLNHKGFGFLLMMPAAFNLLPIGAIPGVTAVSGILLFLISVQMLLGRPYPWLPKIIKNYSLDCDKLAQNVNKAKPVARKIDRYIHPRYQFFSHTACQRVIAGLCCLLAVGIILIGFIPFASFIISLPIFMLALGISTKDGLVTMIGLLFAVLCASIILGFIG